MREIKFRAWDNKHKEWLLGYELENLGGFSLYGECMLLGEWSGVVDTFLFSKNGCTPEDLKVMQYTGLKDKNGKEIYDGDILGIEVNGNNYEDENDLIESMVGTVSFKSGAFGIDLPKGRYYRTRYTSPEPEVGLPYGEPDGKDPLKSLRWSIIQSRCMVIGNIYENPELL